VQPEPLAPLRELAPSLRLLADATAKDVEDPDRLAAIYGPLAEYDLVVILKLARARRATPELALPLFAKAAALDQQIELEVGDYLVDLDRPEDAAAAYERAIARSRDRVAVSTGVKWLVGHYCDLGSLSRARAVAEMAADVYSAGGLSTMAYLMERLGRYDDAAAWYQKMVERYDRRDDLDEFYVRYQHRVGGDRFGIEAAEARDRIFPTGLKPVSLADLKTPPGRLGVAISERSQKNTRLGLQKDDVVVALNGLRVINEAQYRCVWRFTDDPSATLIVWRDGRYMEVKGSSSRVNYGKIPASHPTR
jgi:tetratricopeptide (TPR) repeat protein